MIDMSNEPRRLVMLARLDCVQGAALTMLDRVRDDPALTSMVCGNLLRATALRGLLLGLGPA